MERYYIDIAMSLASISGEVRLFCMPMNLLTVLLLAGSYATLLATHPISLVNERRFLRLATFGWVANLSYIIVEIIKYRLAPIPRYPVPPALAILNALALCLSTLASLLFLEASLAFLKYPKNFVEGSRILGVLLALATFLPLNDRNIYLAVITSNIFYNAASLIILAKAISKLTTPLLGTGSPGVSKRLVYPLWVYAAIQLTYLLLWIPGGTHTAGRWLAIGAVAGAVGFSLAFLCKLVHLTGIVGYSAVRTVRLQRLALEERTLRTQKRFISEMVHELKTPAAELNLQLDRLQGAVLAKQGIREEVKGVREIMTRLLAIVHGAYDLVNDGTRDRPVLDVPMIHNVNNVLQSAILSLKAALQEQGIDAYVPVSTQLSYKPLVRIRRSELMKVFINALKNSYEALGNGGSIRVRTQKVRPSHSDGFSIVITLSDTGSGIPAQILSRVTEDGFSTKNGPGRGHGLAICKRIVENSYGGKFEIDSPTYGDRGTTVTITLPASTDEN